MKKYLSILIVILAISCSEDSLDIQPPTMYSAEVRETVRTTLIEYTDSSKSEVLQKIYKPAEMRIIRTFDNVTFARVKELEKEYNASTETLESGGTHIDYHKSIEVKVRYEIQR